MELVRLAVEEAGLLVGWLKPLERDRRPCKAAETMTGSWPHT